MPGWRNPVTRAPGKILKAHGLTASWVQKLYAENPSPGGYDMLNNADVKFHRNSYKGFICRSNA